MTEKTMLKSTMAHIVIFITYIESKREEIVELGFVIPDNLTEEYARVLWNLYRIKDTYPVALLANYQQYIKREFDMLERHAIQLQTNFDTQYLMEQAIATILQDNGFDMQQVYVDGKQQFIIREARQLGMVFPEGDENGNQS